MTAAKHLDHLDKFFSMLAVNSLAINLTKCMFMVPDLEILGHILKKLGTTPNHQHILVIIKCPPPGHETAAGLPGHGQLLPPPHTRYCSS
jgi:hypothetical protein